MIEPSSGSRGRVKLVPRPQQFWKSWDEVPDLVPEEFMHVKFFVEIFAGKAGLSRGVQRRGKLAVLPPIEIEVSENVPFAASIMDEKIKRKLEAWIRAGVIYLIHFGTPCTSFSRARRDDGGPPPVRNDDNLQGVTGLEGYDLELVTVGNQLMVITAELATLCSAVGTLWSIENPASSMLWLMPEMLKLRSLLLASSRSRSTCASMVDPLRSLL